MDFLFTQVGKLDSQLAQIYKHNPKQIGRIYAVIGTLFLFFFEFFAKYSKMNTTNIILIRGLVDSFLCLYLRMIYLYFCVIRSEEAARESRRLSEE